MHRLIRPSAFVATGAVALAALAAVQPAAAAAPVVINEFSASTVGTDVEYVELLTAPGTDLSAYRVLQIEGDSPVFGVVDGVYTPGAPDASGRVLINLPANAIENGTVSLLLVTGTIPASGSDIDTNDDGVIDAAGLTVVDAVAVNDGGATDRTYGGVTLGVAYDGQAFAPGGASRIPDGTDTDTTADWVRNDFDLAGIPGFAGTPVYGEAINTPGAANAIVPKPVDPAGDADCTASVQAIGSVQGTGDASPAVGSVVRLEGTVVGDFQTGGFDGFSLQDAGDGDPATSDGIFVYRNDPDDTPGNGEGALDVAPGDVVNVAGVVSEFQGLTEITANDMEICATGGALPAPATLTLPATDSQREALESMYVTMPQPLAILEYFEFGRYGTIDAGLTRQYQPTATFDAGTPEAAALAASNLVERVTIDDGRLAQNPSPAMHPNGQPFALDNSFRGGDKLTSVTGVLDQRIRSADGASGYGIQLTQPAGYQVANPRPAVPTVGGDLKVSSFNVLNFFTTIDPTPNNSNDDDYTRGADTTEEFHRQEAKIVAALSAIDADVFGLMEIENNGSTTGPSSSAVAELTRALNANLPGGDVYGYVNTGKVGTDAITTAFLYKKATVKPLGDFALLTSAVDPRFIDTLNRPALAQTFGRVSDGAAVTVVVNHLKSKGSACTSVGDPDTGDGQGNCNGVRTQAAHAITDWLATDPTGQGTGDRSLIIGDLNSYDKEDPIQAFEAAGYTDLLLKYQGEDAYSYDFDGQLGYLDHALAGPGLVADVTGASPWNINADEPSLIDYDMSFKQPLEDALWAPDPYRSSDHDPVIVGIDLPEPDTTAPTLEVTPSVARIFPPNNAFSPVTIDVHATDDSGGPVTVELVEAKASGAKKAEIVTLSDTSFQVRAVNKAVYTFTYKATDAAGNTITATAEVVVGPAG
ncbi:ExeM/NucH family extracellular endonuclease [Microbacterium sp. B2969]|uniref:ExeM/NucH family extracellular endonuclease n=1 Tax=Microbacterium alkaliflavum TaxID=3248839 RepID=A0ABW7QD44_9MICO